MRLGQPYKENRCRAGTDLLGLSHLSLLLAHVLDIPRAREEVVAVLVEADGHDAVRQVKGLLHAVAVMHVNVQVQDPGVILEELQDGQHEVVDVAKPARLAFLGVVQPSRPVNRNVTQAVVEPCGAVYGTPRVDLARARALGTEASGRTVEPKPSARVRGGGGGGGGGGCEVRRRAGRAIHSKARHVWDGVFRGSLAQRALRLC